MKIQKWDHLLAANVDPNFRLTEANTIDFPEYCTRILVQYEYSRALHNTAFGPTKMQRCAKSVLFKFQYFPALIQGFSTVQVILSALIQDFSAV